MGNQAEVASPTLPRIGELIAGKYTIDRILATGGMGVVVAAKHVRLEQRVAIKFLLPEMLDREELVARFLREAQATVGLHGEHAVRVYDVGTLETGSPYLVMELLRGNDLDEELEVRGPLEVEEAIDYILQACEAIAEAHRVGIVHRDIKPSNLFLARRPDGSRIVKVVDFGISKLLADEAQREINNKLTTTTAMLGSPQYMSPEQVRSAKDVDGRTDIWSLGCVFFEMLANTPPFSAETVSAVSAMIVADKPLSLRALRGDVDSSLSKVVSRCLEKNREKRFRTVAELAEALTPFASARSKHAIERVVRISHAPRYESSQPPPGASGDRSATTAATSKLRPDATTVSEVAPGTRRPPRFNAYQETLSATSTSSESGFKSYSGRNGLLVGAAAIIAGVFVWALIGRAPVKSTSGEASSMPKTALEQPQEASPSAAEAAAPDDQEVDIAAAANSPGAASKDGGPKTSETKQPRKARSTAPKIRKQPRIAKSNADDSARTASLETTAKKSTKTGPALQDQPTQPKSPSVAPTTGTFDSALDSRK
jgi:serine/threonine-protein kinase